MKISARVGSPVDLYERFASANVSGISKYFLAQQASRLSQADHFDSLICMNTLRDVEQYAYQIETVRKVMRSFRGRVLLADEVGLGKTIEAGMVLKEYMLRGMVKKTLILTPPALMSQWCPFTERNTSMATRYMNWPMSGTATFVTGSVTVATRKPIWTSMTSPAMRASPSPRS